MDNLQRVIDYATNPEKTDKDKSKYSDADYQALRDLLAYAENEEKTEQMLFCQGINCNVTEARDQFIGIKEQYEKTDGIQAYHGYLSFKEQDITPELAQKIGMEFAQRVWGDRFQIVVTTHLNTNHLHCHFVINSVSFVDGKRLHGEEKVWWKFRHIADEICRQYQLHVIEEPERNQNNRYLTAREKAGMPVRFDPYRQVVDEALAHSGNLKEFAYALEQMGYQYQLSDSRKYWTIKGPNDDKAFRMKRLGDNYTNERIVERLKENARNRADLVPFQREAPKPRQYRLATREHHIMKRSGLYRRYLFYCYKIGFLPNYKKPNAARLHRVFHEDLRKLDELTAQTTLLGKHHIGDDQQLLSYQQSVEEQIKTLTADRTRLRNEIRRVDITDERLSAAKAEIIQISEKLKPLRKEVKLCQGIAERSGIIAEKLREVLAEEEILKGKERDRNDKQR